MGMAIIRRMVSRSLDIWLLSSNHFETFQEKEPGKLFPGSFRIRRTTSDRQTRYPKQS
jgi:hypothetical protein